MCVGYRLRGLWSTSGDVATANATATGKLQQPMCWPDVRGVAEHPRLHPHCYARVFVQWLLQPSRAAICTARATNCTAASTSPNTAATNAAYVAAVAVIATATTASIACELRQPVCWPDVRGSAEHPRLHPHGGVGVLVQWLLSIFATTVVAACTADGASVATSHATTCIAATAYAVATTAAAIPTVCGVAWVHEHVCACAGW